MITGFSLIATILGGLTAAIPKAFELFEKKLSFAQEMKIREHEANMRREEQEFQIKAKTMEGMAKIEESYYNAVSAEGQASREMLAEHLAQLTKPTGYVTFDRMNAMMRPFTMYFFLVMFGIAFVSWLFGLANIEPEFGKALGSSFMFAFESVIFFVFGARQVAKPGSINIFGK